MHDLIFSPVADLEPINSVPTKKKRSKKKNVTFEEPDNLTQTMERLPGRSKRPNLRKP